MASCSSASASARSEAAATLTRWMQDGKPVEQTRTVEVQANSWQRVDFTRPETPPAEK